MDENHKDIPKYDETNNDKISENSDQASCKVLKRTNIIFSLTPSV